MSTRARWQRGTWGLLPALVLTASACDLPPPRARPTLLAAHDLEAIADDPTKPALFPDSGVPGGLPIDDYVTQVEGGHRLTLRDTWTEGYRSAYVTTELWSGFDEVWVQPMYVPFTTIVGGVPQRVTDGDHKWHPIFGVGPKSAFYSPFWQIIYFRVPAGTAFDAFKSVREVLDSGAELVPARGRAMALVPNDVVLPKMSDVPEPAAASDRPVGSPNRGEGFLDGQPVSFLDFGADTFRWNDDLVVEEIPLFVFVRRLPDGTLARLPVPTVAGTGPLYANRPADAADPTHPRYGAFWRLYTVEIPPAAQVFAPAGLFDTFRAMIPDALLVAPVGAKPLKDAGGDPRSLDEFLGKIALNAVPEPGAKTGCFETYDQLDTNVDKFPAGGCQWLDSQPKIEAALVPEAIKRTDIVVTCPFVSYHDMAVTP